MARLRLTGVLAALMLLLVLLPAASAEARTGVRVGIGDQQIGMFDNPWFQAAKFKRVRYFIPWNAMDNRNVRLVSRAYVVRARRSHISVFLHISTDDLRIKKAHLPSVSAYKRKVGRLVRYFRKLGVKEFGVWNEANHKSQPTYRSPRRAAQYFKVMYGLVKRHCRSCSVVALDVLDQTGVEKYMRSWYRHLSRTWRRRASLVGLHNYGDVNRKRTRFTRNIISISRHYNRRSKFWFTETGGIVNFGKNFPCNETRAANRLKQMFSLVRKYHRRGVRRVYVYNWTGAGCQARFDAGLTNPDGSPRQGYTYLRSALRHYLR